MVLHGVDQPADVEVGVLEEPGVDLHLPLQHRLQRVVHLVPGRDRRPAGRQLRVRGTTPSCLLPREGRLALGVPAIGELAGVLVRPLQRHVVRGVGRAGREVHEERLVRRQRLLGRDPVDRAVGQVLGEVVALLGGRLRLDRGGAVVEGRVVLVVLAADEAVEVSNPPPPDGQASNGPTGEVCHGGTS